MTDSEKDHVSASPAPAEGRGLRNLTAVGAAAGWISLYFWLRFAVSFILMFAYVFIGAFAAHGDVNAGLNWAVRYKQDEITFIEIIVSTVALFAAVWIVGLIRDNRKPAELRTGFFRDTGFVRFRPALIPVLLVMGFSLNMLVSLLFAVLPIPEELLLDYEEQSEMLNETSLLSVLSTAVFAPLSEELVFRGLLISRLRRGLPTLLAALIPSLIFGLIHGQILWICYAFLLGLCLSFVCLRTRSTSASVLLHAAFNASGFVLPLLPIAEDAPESVFYGLLAASAAISLALGAALVLLTREKKTPPGGLLTEASE